MANKDCTAHKGGVHAATPYVHSHRYFEGDDTDLLHQQLASKGKMIKDDGQSFEASGLIVQFVDWHVYVSEIVGER